MADLKDKKLRNSILNLLLIYYLAESAVFLATARTCNFSLSFTVIFFCVQTAFFAITGVFLIFNRNLFYIIKTENPSRARSLRSDQTEAPSGETLSSVNFACRITLFRITMIPSVFFLIIAHKTYPVGKILAFLIGLTCLSDLFDGYISRQRNEVTFIGKILDSSSDYLLLGTVAIAYYIHQLLPSWLFWLILSRLLVHSLGMMILFLLRKKLIPQTTVFGKIAIAAVMILFVFTPAKLIFPVLRYAAKFIEAGAGILIALSLVDKGFFLVREISGILKSAKSQSGPVE